MKNPIPPIDFEQTARSVITNPEDFAHHPIIRAAAWATMMQARGNTVDLDSMACTLLDTHRAEVTAESIAQTRTKIETALEETRPHGPLQMARTSQAVRATQAKRAAPQDGDAA